MGVPFPLGLRRLADHAPGLILCVRNQCLLATLLAIHAGFAVVIATALVLYALTLWVFPALDQQTAD